MGCVEDCLLLTITIHIPNGNIVPTGDGHTVVLVENGTVPKHHVRRG